jgi:DNA-binding response OmpR family regulator
LATCKSKKVVLCIGNDLVNLNLRCGRLQNHGWEVISSGAGHDGVRRFGHEPVDAVVIDLNDDDGSETALIAAELKRQRQGVPIVILIRNQALLVPGATAQADAVVQKAEEIQQLPNTLETLLRPA